MTVVDFEVRNLKVIEAAWERQLENRDRWLVLSHRLTVIWHETHMRG